MRLPGFGLFVVVALVECRGLPAQMPPGEDLGVHHESWTFKNGAPENVEALAQTADGYLWLGTPSGLFRFDGTRFSPFRSPFGQRMLSTNVTALYAPPDGGLWVGYQFGGFSFIEDGQVENYGGDAFGSRTVFAFAQDGAGRLWAATSNGLWLWADSTWTAIGAEWKVPNKVFYSVVLDDNGVLWALGSAGDRGPLVYLRPGARTFETTESTVPYSAITLNVDRTVVTDSSSGPDAPDPPLPLVSRRYRLVDRVRDVWTMDYGGVRRSGPPDRGDGVAGSAPDGGDEPLDLNPWPGSMLVDREGNVWVGGRTGLHRFFHAPLIGLYIPGAVGDFALAAGERGSIWVGSGRCLYRVSDGSASPCRRLPGDVASLYRALDKTLWVGSTGALWKVSDPELTPVQLPTTAISVQGIVADSLAGLWVSLGRRGLFRLAEGSWAERGGRQDVPDGSPISEFRDPLNRLWFGYADNMLVVLDGDRARTFGPGEGLRVGNVTAIYARGPEVWIGGEFGLEQFDEGRFRAIHPADEQWLRGISGIVETAEGDLWLNGLSGIFHIARAEVAEALKDSTYQVRGEHFGRRAGLPGIAAQLRPLPTAIQGTDGRLWFAVSNGVVWLDPSRATGGPSAPPITIESVSADDRSYDPLGTLRFPAGTSSVQIGYAAVSLSDPEAIRFRYKVQETDRDWHDGASESPVSFRNLAPGSYHFTVAATDANGVWGDNVATAEFTILPAFYQTKWFLALCLVGGVATLYLAYLMRLRHLAREFNVRIEERVAERTRIARELHDTLLQSFQGVLYLLQAASGLLATRPSAARDMLEDTIRKAAHAVTEGRSAVQGLRAPVVAPNDLARAIGEFGETARQARTHPEVQGFQVSVQGTPRPLARSLRDEVYRIACEAVTNGFRHSRADRVEVVVHYGPRSFALTVRDDGVGIDPKTADEAPRNGHFGLSGMRERAKLMGGRLTVSSAVGVGTEIRLDLPAGRAFEGGRPVRAWFGLG